MGEDEGEVEQGGETCCYAVKEDGKCLRENTRHENGLLEEGALDVVLSGF